MSTNIKKQIHVSNNQPTLPDNSGYTYIWDTTNWVASVSGSLGKSASLSSVGVDRGRGAGCTVEFSVSPTAQAVTVYEAVLNGAGAWETFFSISVAAGNTQPLVWTPTMPDWIIYIVAGATKPTTLATTFLLVRP